MDFLTSFILGTIQGLTEFLPVSSSGHLVIGHHLFGFTGDNLLFDTILHLGTAVAILIVFRNDLLALARGFFSRDTDTRAHSLSYTGKIIAGTIPAGLAGVFFKDHFELAFASPRFAGAMLLVTAALLFISARRSNGAAPVTLGAALLIGVAQAFAIFPGISRSGSTIATALLLGVARPEAGKFSFMLALPAIFGAIVLQISDIETLSIAPPVIALGFIASLAAGYAALKLLLHFVNQGKLHYFGYYCALVGVIVLLTMGA
jgi:undecaprenyl-diphosphatase